MLSLAQCDEMLNNQQGVLDSMLRIKNITTSQQDVLNKGNGNKHDYQGNTSLSRAEIKSMATSYSEKPPPYAFPTSNELTTFLKNFIQEDDNLATASSALRNGAQSHGRCHSCNKTDSPEWSNGPNGARNLCNTCDRRWPFRISFSVSH